MFVVTEDWYFWSHRLDLARAARDEGYQVLVATRVKEHGKRIENEGFFLLPLQWERVGFNPCREAVAFLALLNLYRRERPSLVFHVALKAVLYGSWAARFGSCPAVVNAITGLGWMSSAKTWPAAWLYFGLKRLLRRTLTLPNTFSIFQNEEDAKELSNAQLQAVSRSAIIRGSGVDTSRFHPMPESAGVPVVMLAARMLWPKGIAEFIAAIQMLKLMKYQARYVLVGMIDPENPSHIPQSQLLEWQEQQLIEWWGYRDDMPDVLGAAHIVVLPTYYGEGLPKVLLEAAACGRPIITTKMRGCSDIVRDGVNGLLIPTRDPESLALAISTLIENPLLRARMGARGREIVVNGFSSERIAQEYLALFRRALEPSASTVAGPLSIGNIDRPGTDLSVN